MSSPAASSSLSITAPQPTLRDPESHKPGNDKPSYFRLLLDHAGVNQDVLDGQYRGNGTPQDAYIVDFLTNDPRNPLQFPAWKKWSITILQALAVFALAFTSTAYSSSVADVKAEFQASTTIAILGVSMFVAGFAFGPLLWAPLSEMYGRQVLFFLTYMALVAFNAAAAAAPNMPALIIFRLLGGTFGSSPLTNAGGVIADMFSARERGIATAVFAMAPFLGPSIGPIAAGFLDEYAGWRWVEGLLACFTGTIWIVISLSVPETYAPVILRRRAEKLSKIAGKVYISEVDVGKPTKTAGAEFKVAISRPLILLFTEPIVFCTSLYVAVVYGTLYMMFAAFPIVFQQQRGWSQGISGLAFLGIAVGVVFAVGFCMYDAKRYIKASDQAEYPLPAEARLPAAILGSVLLPIGLFWFAWTNGAGTHWVDPIIASAFFSAGLILVFLSLMNYLIDSYVIYAASVLAANSVLRSLFGAAFPLFTTSMYKSLGIHWASSIPAFLALACLPFPLLFFKFGEAIRLKSKYSAEAANLLLKMQTSVDNDEPVPRILSGHPNEQESIPPEQDKGKV
ncbi:major facilitator superfamily domain-containing protein [Penicillium sp. CMV-2018d]|nr:major facilitator superfamily domain-containing protein [Penicillium sp. CMV-2018d]